MGTYATSTIKLYNATPSSRWELIPSKLFVVDDIEAYLATKTAKTITLFQYIKPQLEIEIKVDLSQTYIEPLNNSYKYVRIENSDDTGHYYYYFVKNAEWRAKSTVRFVLVMDVLNTFKEGTHYNFKANTKITREHKDRFIINQRTLVLTIDDIDGGAGSLGEEDTVVLRNMDHDNEYMVTGIITQYDNLTLTIIIQDDLTPQQINNIFESPTQYLDLISVSKDNANYIEAYFNAFSLQLRRFRNIDYIQENINPVLQCGNAEGTLIEKSSPLNVDWYLLYRNQNDPDPDDLLNPVECYLIPSDEINVSASDIVAGRLNASSLQLSYYYYVSLDEPTQTMTLDNGTVLTAAAGANKGIVCLKRNSDNTITVEHFEGQTNFSKVEAWTCKYVTLNTLPMNYKYSLTKATTNSFYDLDVAIAAMSGDSWTNTLTPSVLDDITKLDKADPKNIKLIKLPYSPYEFTITSSKIDVTNDSKWDYLALDQANNRKIFLLKLNDLNTDLHSTLNPSSNPLTNLEMSAFTPSVNDLRQGAEYESKLFNSEFYRGTYVYDSFQFAIQLEKCDINEYYIYQDMTIYFDMTKTINSKFMFTFASYKLRNATESYAKYMPIARNNEEVLYNVPYINYVKTGFNYDIKSKNLSNASNWIGAGLSTAGVVASLALPTAPLKALGVITSLISMAMTAKSAITSTIQNEQSIERKLKESSMQTASVAGSDDVDLMSIYAENRLKYLVYEPTPIMKEMLYNLFFYAGYASNRLGKPVHNTRVNFDYLECDASIEKIANIPDDCLNELINSFKYGVTYIHKSSRTSILSKWDFEQKYENWEVSLL